MPPRHHPTKATGEEPALSAGSALPDARLQSLLERRTAFLGFIKRRVNDPELAEDILQAAYMRALKHTGTLPTEDNSAITWFYSVLRNAVIDHYRRRATESSALERFASDLGLTGPNAAEPSIPAPDTRIFICGCIAHVLPTLRPAYADILREVDLDEAPLADFAARHSLTPGNAAVRAHRARAALRRELARFCGACTFHACLNCICKAPATT